MYQNIKKALPVPLSVLPICGDTAVLHGNLNTRYFTKVPDSVYVAGYLVLCMYCTLYLQGLVYDVPVLICPFCVRYFVRHQNSNSYFAFTTKLPDSDTVVRSIGGAGSTTKKSVGAGGHRMKYQRNTGGVVLGSGQQKPIQLPPPGLPAILLCKNQKVFRMLPYGDTFRGSRANYMLVYSDSAILRR